MPSIIENHHQTFRALRNRERRRSISELFITIKTIIDDGHEEETTISKQLLRRFPVLSVSAGLNRENGDVVITLYHTSYNEGNLTFSINDADSLESLQELWKSANSSRMGMNTPIYVLSYAEQSTNRIKQTIYISGSILSKVGMVRFGQTTVHMTLLDGKIINICCNGTLQDRNIAENFITSWKQFYIEAEGGILMFD